MADDLGDEWWLTYASLLNDGRGFSTKLGSDGKGDKFEGLEVSLPADSKRGFKRKLADEDGSKISLKKSKEDMKSLRLKEKKKEKKKISAELDEILSKPGEPKDLIAMMTKELKERLSPDALVHSLPSIDSDFFLCNLNCSSPSDYMKGILPRWREAVKESYLMRKTGSPCILVITSSAIRAVELNRQLKTFAGEKCRIVKLFSKHIKVEEQKKFLSKHVCQLGIGTPNRILLLIKQGALELESLAAVVLDWNWRDAKLKRLPDIPQIRGDLTSLLKDHLLEIVQASPCKIALL